MRQDPLNIDKKILSGYDLKQILKICGYTLKEFTNDEADHSYTWMRETLGNSERIPLRYFDKIIKYVSKVNFLLAVENIVECRRKYNIILENSEG